MKKLSIVFLAALLYLVVGLSGSGLAADKPVPVGAGEGRTRITSQKLQYSHQGRQITFEGDVYVDRSDFKLRADLLTVFLNQDGKSGVTAENAMTGDQKIERIVATGHVRMDKDGRVGRCAKATYLANEGVLRLEGDPVLEDGKNSVQGQVILFFVNENRSIVEGDSSKPVEAVFFTGKELKDTKGKLK